MSDKLYNPKEAAVAVLSKVHELLAKSELAKAEKLKKQGNTLGAAIGYPGASQTAPAPTPPPMPKSELVKYETENKKAPSKPPKDPSKKTERDYEDYEIKSGKSKSSNNKQQEKQTSPSKNPKEESEGNNEPYGTEPKDLGKKEHEHIGWDKLHSKLEREGYSKKSADKIAGSIKAKVNKSENPDKDADAELGEKVEKDVEDHFKENKDAEKKEGHKLMTKSCPNCGEMHKSEDFAELCSDLSTLNEDFEELAKSEKSKKLAHKVESGKEGLKEALKDSKHPKKVLANLRNEKVEKAETKHDRCVEHVEENSPEVTNPHAVCSSVGVPRGAKSENTSSPSVFIPGKIVGSAKLSKFMERKHAKRKAGIQGTPDEHAGEQHEQSQEKLVDESSKLQGHPEGNEQQDWQGRDK